MLANQYAHHRGQTLLLYIENNVPTNMDTKSAGLALTLLAMATFLVVACIGNGTSADGTNNEQPIEFLQGYIYDIPPLEDSQPIGGVTVTTWVGFNVAYETTTTDSNGMFKVKSNNDVKYISFSLQEYTVKDWYDKELFKTGESDLYEIRLHDDSQVDGVHNLYGNAGKTAIISRTVASLFGNVTGTVKGIVIPMANANVTLKSSTHTLNAVTDAAGHFSVACSSATFYTVTVTANGFDAWVAENVQALGEPLQVNLVEKNHVIIMGLDITHTLTLFGLLITMLIILVAIYLVKRPEQHGKIYVINDVPTRKSKEKKK